MTESHDRPTDLIPAEPRSPYAPPPNDYPLPFHESERGLPPPAPQKRGFNGCAYGCAGMGGCLLLIGAAVAALILSGAMSVNGLLGGIGTALGAAASAPPRAQVFSTQSVVTSIQPLGQLVSVSAQMAKADIFVGVQQGALNSCGFGANHVAQGAVEAGLDLTQLGPDSVAFDALRNTYVVTLAAPQLTSCRVDYIRQYDRTTTACNVDWDEARLLASYTSLIEFRDDALEGGILNRAAAEARDVLTNFIGLTTGANVEIVFQPAALNPDGTPGSILPASCAPDQPPGWSFDSAAGSWIRMP